MKSIKELFSKYIVKDCDSVETFVEQYYKHERFRGRGEEYAKLIIASQKEDLREDGICIISHHESVTGEIVAFIPKQIKYIPNQGTLDI